MTAGLRFLRSVSDLPSGGVAERDSTRGLWHREASAEHEEFVSQGAPIRREPMDQTWRNRETSIEALDGGRLNSVVEERGFRATKGCRS